MKCPMGLEGVGTKFCRVSKNEHSGEGQVSGGREEDGYLG